MKNKILIGPVNKENIGSIPTLNRAFADGLSDKYEFIPFNITRKYGKSKTSNFNLLNIFYFIKQYFILIRQVLVSKPFIMHYAITSYWNFEKSLLFLHTAKLLGVKKVVGHLHGGSFDEFAKNLNGTRKKISLNLFNKLDAIVVASNYWKDYLKNLQVNTLIEVVNNPIDMNYVVKVNNKLNQEMKNEKFLFIGSLGERKGFYDIIDVAKKSTNEFILDAIGSEDRKNDLNNIKKLIFENQLSSKINIIESEKLSLDDKVSYFTKNEVFLFPSHNENFPLVIIEAACAGMPIITTPVGAIPEFFTHMKNIYFVKPGNIQDIENAINFMIKNPEQRKQIGIAARELYNKKLSSEIIMRQIDEVYTTLISQA